MRRNARKRWFNFGDGVSLLYFYWSHCICIFDYIEENKIHDKNTNELVSSIMNKISIQILWFNGNHMMKEKTHFVSVIFSAGHETYARLNKL